MDETIEVKFYDSVEDTKIKFAVIAARYYEKWVFCKHKERSTFEFPGGHREPGEAIADTARRELYEETGAAEYTLTPICVYSVTGKTRANPSGEESFGKLYYAEITRFSPLPESEIERIFLSPSFPEQWTYPHIQPRLIEKIMHHIL